MPPPPSLRLERPVIRDQLHWEQILFEHRRALFERFLEFYPELLRTHNTDVRVWRARLSGQRIRREEDDAD